MSVPLCMFYVVECWLKEPHYMLYMKHSKRKNRVINVYAFFLKQKIHVVVVLYLACKPIDVYTALLGPLKWQNIL